MLFLNRPRQTWMPFQRPLGSTEQAAYNRRLQDKFQATQRVERPPAPATSEVAPQDPVDALQALARLKEAGALTDEEFAVAKAKVLGTSSVPA